MNSGNGSKEMVKSFIDLANMEKGLVDENQQLFESKGLHSVGSGETSASTTTDTNASFALLSNIKRTIEEKLIPTKI